MVRSHNADLKTPDSKHKPGDISEGRVVVLGDQGDGVPLLGVVEDHRVQGGHGKHHSIGQINKGGKRLPVPGLAELKEGGAEADHHRSLCVPC